MFVRFEIVTCCGDHVKFTDQPVSAFECDYGARYGWDDCEPEFEAVGLAGYPANAICDGCYDRMFRARFVELFDADDIRSGNDYPLPFTD